MTGSNPHSTTQQEQPHSAATLGQALNDTTSAYQTLFTKGLAFISSNWRANLRVMLVACCLLGFAVTVAVVIWFGLHALLGYVMVSFGIHWLVTAGLLMVGNVILMYYLIATALSLFSAATRSLLRSDIEL